MWYRPYLVSFMPTSGTERRFSNQSSYWSVFGVRTKLHFLTLCENFRNFLYFCLGFLYFDARRHQYQYQLLTALLRNRIFSVEVTHGLRVNRHVNIFNWRLKFYLRLHVRPIVDHKKHKMLNFFHIKLYFFRAHQTLFDTGNVKPYTTSFTLLRIYAV